jgi:hypothetical protein
MIIKHRLHIFQEYLFDIVINLAFFLLLISILGFSQSAQKYLNYLDYYIRIYICLFLIWRFNPLRSSYEFTTLDAKIAFNGGIFLLTTTALNQYLKTIANTTTKDLLDIETDANKEYNIVKTDIGNTIGF